MELKKLFDETAAKKAAVMKFIDALIDGQSFVETDVLRKTTTPLGEAEGEGIVSGFASISDIQVALFATNPEVLKGSVGAAAAKKIKRVVKSALKAEAPVIAVLDTSGARFAEGVEAVNGYASVLKAFSQAYGEVPTITIVKGNNFGMLSYLTAFSDVVIGFEKSVMATSSPLIVAAKAGADAETVGTAKAHTASGIYSAVVKSEKELKPLLGKILGYFARPAEEAGDDPNRTGKNKSAAPAAVIADVFDKGTFTEVKAGFAPSVVTGFARLNGASVGIVANNGGADAGKLTADGAVKICDLLTTCASFGLPIVNLVDCAGVTVDLKSENAGLIREIGNMIFTYNRTDIPKLAVITGNAFGLGYAAFAGSNVCDYTAAWNTAKIGVIDSAAAAQLLYAGDIAKAKDKAKAEAKYAETYAEENQSAAVAGVNGYVDNVIEPTQTRQYLIAALQAYAER